MEGPGFQRFSASFTVRGLISLSELRSVKDEKEVRAHRDEMVSVVFSFFSFSLFLSQPWLFEAL